MGAYAQSLCYIVCRLGPQPVMALLSFMVLCLPQVNQSRPFHTGTARG